MEIHTDESLCQVPERSVLFRGGRGGGGGGAQPPLQLFRPRHVGPPPSGQVPRQRRPQGPRQQPPCRPRGGGGGGLYHRQPELEARRHGRHLSSISNDTRTAPSRGSCQWDLNFPLLDAPLVGYSTVAKSQQ